MGWTTGLILPLRHSRNDIPCEAMQKSILWFHSANENIFGWINPKTAIKSITKVISALFVDVFLEVFFVFGLKCVLTFIFLVFIFWHVHIRGERFELVESASWGVISNRLSYPLKMKNVLTWHKDENHYCVFKNILCLSCLSIC